MTIDDLRAHWGLFLALGLFLIVALIAAVAVYRRSAAGQLRGRLRALRDTQRGLARVRQAVAAAETRVAKLEGRAAKVRPRALTEAREAVEDAQALEKIMNDRVLVAANHLRRVIFEEFPPAKQQRLRTKFLPDDKPDNKPFSF